MVVARKVALEAAHASMRVLPPASLRARYAGGGDRSCLEPRFDVRLPIVLLFASEDVAIALGHQDGGNLVRRLYGHRDKHRALDRIVSAYATRTQPKQADVSPNDPAAVQESLF